MRRGRLLLLIVVIALGLAVGLVTVSLLRAPTPTVAERPPAPVVETRKPPLQADAEGYYVPGYSFTVDRFRFVRLSLRPEAFVVDGCGRAHNQDRLVAVCTTLAIGDQSVIGGQ